MSDRMVILFHLHLLFGCDCRVRKSNYLVVVKTSSQDEGASRREWLLVYLVSQTLKPVNDLFLYSAFLSIKYSIFDLLFTHVSWLRRCLGSFRLIQIFSVLDLSRLSMRKTHFFEGLEFGFTNGDFNMAARREGPAKVSRLFRMNFI